MSPLTSDIPGLLAAAPPSETTLTLLRTAVAAAIFVALLLGVMSVFAQRGRTQITPERQVALAAGHADRHTVFEMPLTQPIMWLLLVTVRALPLTGLKEKVRQWLVAAGSPNFYTPSEYLAVSLLWGLMVTAVVEASNVIAFGQFSWTLLPIALGAGFGGHIYHLNSLATRRVRDISRRAPYTLDLLALSMGAGATFTEAVRTVVREDPEHPFNVELNTVLAEVELGTTRAQALRNMADRVPLESLRSIVAAIIQAEGLGTPLSDVLKEQANLMRLQRSVRAEKLAAQASVRILLPSLLILLSVVLTVFAPFIILAVRGELF